MNGFGQELETKTIGGRIFHSCTLEGIDFLLQNFTPGRAISCSTSDSTKLFGRGMVIVLEDREWVGDYTPYDADAGKNYGWDEFRVRFKSLEEFVDAIDSIIVPIGWVDAWEQAWEDEESADSCFFHLIEDQGLPYPTESNRSFFNF